MDGLVKGGISLVSPQVLGQSRLGTIGIQFCHASHGHVLPADIGDVIVGAIIIRWDSVLEVDAESGGGVVADSLSGGCGSVHRQAKGVSSVCVKSISNWVALPTSGRSNTILEKHSLETY